MSDETPAEQTPDVPAPVPAPPEAGDAVTEGGYAYTVVDETPGAKPAAKTPKVKRESTPLRIAWPLLAALILVPAMAAGVGAWFASDMLGDDSGGGDRASANVASVIGVFSQSQGPTLRLEGELPAGVPDDLPSYPGARVVSAQAQATGGDALYLIVYDTADSLDDVSRYFDDALGEDPWQVDLGQDAPDTATRQFSKIDDADIEGQLILADSKDSDLTTIFAVVQIISGADDIELEEFTPPISKSLPEGFPDGIPPYPDAIIMETIFQRAAQGDTFGLTLITRDSADDALAFFTDDLEGKGWTVEEGDSSGSTIVDATAISFESDDGSISGNIAAGEFDADENYTEIELQVRELDDDGG